MGLRTSKIRCSIACSYAPAGGVLSHSMQTCVQFMLMRLIELELYHPARGREDKTCTLQPITASHPD